LLATIHIVLLDGPRPRLDELAAALLKEGGFFIQRQLKSAPALAERFGPRLWSIRALVLLTAQRPLIHRAVAKIATGRNPTANDWRRGNGIDAPRAQPVCSRPRAR
jgi:hypothetical protein